MFRHVFMQKIETLVITNQHNVTLNGLDCRCIHNSQTANNQSAKCVSRKSQQSKQNKNRIKYVTERLLNKVPAKLLFNIFDAVFLWIPYTSGCTPKVAQNIGIVFIYQNVLHLYHITSKVLHFTYYTLHVCTPRVLDSKFIQRLDYSPKRTFRVHMNYEE
jgi:hypothetical protein